MDGGHDVDCPGCQGLRGENERLSSLALDQLDRLGALRRLHEALRVSPFNDERVVSMALAEILEADPASVRSLPGRFWTDPLTEVRRAGAA